MTKLNPTSKRLGASSQSGPEKTSALAAGD
jgi:hypothetical protein